ncbi:MAG: cell division protein FtsA [Patescibacteria group bacterium]
MTRRKGDQQLLTGLDIGSTAVRIAVGTVAPTAEGEELHILAAAEAPSQGVNKGIVTSIEDAVSSIAMAMERAERLVGVPLEHAWVGISGTHVETQTSKGTVVVAKSNGEITSDDVDRAIEAARTIATPLNYEILHVIPQTFTVDGQRGLKNPVGMSGVRLEVDAHIIQGVSAHIKNITRAVYRTGLDIDDAVLGILATSEAVLSSRQKELGVAVVNIGGSTTGVSVFEDGDLLYSAVLPIGSAHITNDLAIGLRTDIDVAEAIKVRFGTARAGAVDKKETINLKEVGSLSDESVARKYIATITQARVEEILDKIDAVLQEVGKAGKLPAGIVLTGGGAALDGLVELAKERLHLPVSLGYPVGMGSVTDRSNDLGFSTSIGLVKWGYLAAREQAGRAGSPFSRFGVVDKASQQIKDWFKSLIP